VASGRAKPDGLLVIPPAQTLAFLHPLPIRALWGVGAKTEESLLRIGLHTVGDVADTPLGTLTRAVGEATGQKLHELAHGRDARSVITATSEKSIGHEVTFHTDVADPARVRLEMLRLADQVAARLRRAELFAKTVAIKVRFEDFTTVTRSRTLSEPSNVGRRLYEEASELLGALDLQGRAVRLVGVRAEQLTGEQDAMAALWDPDEEWREAETTIDSLRARFGGEAVRRASLLGRKGNDTAGGTRAPSA
jgi:DNA polymerase-4